MPSKLIELEIARPSIWGVNTSASGDIMPKEYAVVAENIVFSDEGYPESRRGSLRSHSATLQSISSSGVTETIRQIFTTVEDGVEYTIFSTNKKIYRRDAGVPVDITGSATAPTAGNWKFVNINEEVFGFQTGHDAIKLSNIASGTFVDATFVGAEAPATNGDAVQDALASFGRLWVLDGNDLKYSSTLDPEDFNNSGGGGDAGFFNLNAIYLNGHDTPIALAEFNGNLLVLAKDHVTVWQYPWNPNGTGSDYGAGAVASDPPMSVVETIGGVGCVSRDSVQYTQNDIMFLSSQGVTSLSRVVQEKSMPLKRYTDNVRFDVTKLLRDVTPESIWSAYHESKGVYFFGSTEQDGCTLVDTSSPLPDGTFRCVTWTKRIYAMGVLPQASLTSNEDVWGNMLLADEAEYLAFMRGHNDHTPSSGVGGDSYLMKYESAWTAIVDELQNILKFPKKIGVVIRGSGSQTFLVNLAYDYGSFITSQGKTITVSLSVSSTYTNTNYGTATYGTATSIKEAKAMGFGSGRILKIHFSTTVDGNLLSLQRISIQSKIGRQQ